MKTCISCKRELPKTDEYFYFRNKSRGWLSSWCKECFHKHYRGKNPECQKKKRIPKKNLCRECGIEIGKRKRLCDICLKAIKRKQKRYDKAVQKKRLKQAMPKWADRKAIKEFYSNRPEGYEVDHIIPLRGELVSGLHCMENLQYLPCEENRKKSNRFGSGDFNHYSLEHNGVKRRYTQSSTKCNLVCTM